MTRRNDTDPKPLGSGNTDPGLGPPSQPTAPGPAQPETTADVLLDGLGREPSPSDRAARGKPDSDGKLAASFHASPRPVPVRSKVVDPSSAPVVVAGSEVDTLDEPKPAASSPRVEPEPAAPPSPRPRAETTVPGAEPSRHREKLAAFAVTAAVVSIAGIAIVLYRATFGADVSPPKTPAPMQVVAPRVQIPDPQPIATPIELDPVRAEPTALAPPNPGPRPPPRGSGKVDGKNATPPPDDFQDLKQNLKH